MNVISIVGRLTKDPKLTSTFNKTSVCRFNVAVPSEFRNSDGEREVDYFPCVAWRETAQKIDKYFKKGFPIGITGSMNSRVYENAEGKSVPIWEINVKSFYFVATFGETKDDYIRDDDELEEDTEKKSKKTSQLKMTPIEEEGDLPF